MKKSLFLCALFALASLSLAACGGGGDNGSPASTALTTPTTTADGAAGGGSKLQLAADASALKYDETALTTKAGEVTVDFTNPSAIGHDVVIEQGGKEVAKTDVISQSKATLTASLEAGSYTFYCSVPGHKDAGMQGTLTVK